MEREIRILAGEVSLAGDLAVPEGAEGVVVFAHGSGSSRHSPRNRTVAEALQRERLATLLMDLLTDDEERVDRITARLRFDIELLADRLAAAMDDLTLRREPGALSMGAFGASTGGGAARGPGRGGGAALSKPGSGY